jgi:simple sugar transport system ATP-binding protein
MAVADRVTVLRAGRATITIDAEKISEKELARKMVGRDVVLDYQKKKAVPGRVVLEVKGVNSLNDQMRRGLNNFSLSVREGEIVGIAGVAGNGQRELAEVLAGLRWATSGNIFIDGKEVTNLSPREISGFGVGYVPEDRLGMGLVPELDGPENLMLKNYRRPGVSGRWLISRKTAVSEAERLVRDFDVRMSSLRQPVKLLSGGNLQKLLLAREISARPRLLVVVYPARGLDVGATEAVHKLLLEQRFNGAAILLISEDLEEIFKLCDRVGVLFEGELQGVKETIATNLEQIGLLMMGAGKMKGEAS